MDRSAGSDPLVGRLLDGRYQVGPRIARGGMATVYEATDLRLDRRVAVKVVQNSLADDDDFALRFVREARAAARLTHPNVVAVYDQGEDDGTLFLTMEYVAGRHTLRDLIRDEAPLPPIRALALLEDVLKALAAAHESGIVHRDIKPENVLIDPRGMLKVADFGLARAISAATSATRTGGVLMGTVSYLPPELLTDGIADARSDVYSLGVLLFELLTGTKPHAGDNPIQVAYKHVHNDVPPPSSVVDGIPPYLDAFVARATSRRHDLRPADAYVMLQQMRRVRQALHEGVVDDPELTDDLTPTIAIAAQPAVQPSPETPVAAQSSAGPDEVFDVAAFDDFRRDENPGPDFVPPVERTLVVGEARLATPDPPVQPLDLAGADAMSPSGVSPAATGPSAAVGGSGQGSSPARPPYRRNRKRGWIAFLVVMLLAAAAAVTGWYYGVGRFQPTPDVVRMSEAQARQKIEAAGLTFKIGATSYSETVAAGRVIQTDPSPGDKVLEDGGTVRVVLSRGPERHEVPDLANMSETEAAAALTSNSLAVATPIRRWSETVAAGDVISFSPQAGTELRRDGEVTLVVSKGPPPIKIVSFEGEEAEAAEKELTDAGFTVDSVEHYNDDIEKGVVIRQRPARGVGHRGDEIRLVVSLGPHLVEVPDVYRTGEDDAKATLTAAGFTVNVVQYTPYLGFGVVASQSPGSGDKAPFGSEVTIYVI